jgi:site-specific recombinase XerD
MSLAAPAFDAAAALALVQADAASARSYAAASRSDNTKIAYEADCRSFAVWCGERGVSALPAAPATVALYLASMADAGRKASTIARALAALSQAHKLAGYPSPRDDQGVREVLSGIRRTVGTAQTGKAPMMPEAIRTAAASGRDDLIGIRDRALLAVGFAGGFRRSALVGLDAADLAFGPDGCTATIRRDKTDQEGAGRRIGLPYGGNPMTCPVRALRAWLDAAGITAGPVFRGVDRHGNVSAERLSDRSVANVVKDAAERAGLDAAAFSGHSLRAGLATAAAKAGKSSRSIKRSTGHKSDRILDGYVRDAELFADNAAAGLGCSFSRRPRPPTVARVRRSRRRPSPLPPAEGSPRVRGGAGPPSCGKPRSGRGGAPRGSVIPATASARR